MRKHFDFTDPSERYMDLNSVLRSKNLKDMCLLAATAQLTSEYGVVISHYLFTARAGLEKTKPVYFFHKCLMCSAVGQCINDGCSRTGQCETQRNCTSLFFPV